MTYLDLKRIVLQKVFAITDGAVVEDDNTREYITALPGAANEGLQLLATAGRFIKKRFTVQQTEEEPGEQPEDGVRRQTEGSGVIRYDLSQLCPDFYNLGSDGVYFEDGSGRYGRSGNWWLEAGHVLVLDASETGCWTLWYDAYPEELTMETADDYELPLYPEVAVLLPLYVASQIYKDDDVSQAVQYRNEFEVGREALMGAMGRQARGRDQWRSVKGWW